MITIEVSRAGAALSDSPLLTIHLQSQLVSRTESLFHRIDIRYWCSFLVASKTQFSVQRGIGGVCNAGDRMGPEVIDPFGNQGRLTTRACRSFMSSAGASSSYIATIGLRRRISYWFAYVLLKRCPSNTTKLMTMFGALKVDLNIAIDGWIDQECARHTRSDFLLPGMKIQSYRETGQQEGHI